MDIHKIAVKLFLDPPGSPDSAEPIHSEVFVPVFHRWIQTHALADHLLIDVADYSHVHHGPGAVLVSSQANIHLDLGGGRAGLLYVRKLPIEGAGDFGLSLRGVLRQALTAALLMEKDPALKTPVRFGSGELSIGINDRLAAPNTAATFEQLSPAIVQVLGDLYAPARVQLRYEPAAGALFTVAARADGAPPLGELLARLAPVHAA